MGNPKKDKTNMRKKNFIPNFALYLLFLLNLVNAIQHGFNWLFYVSAILTAIVLVLDILEVIHGKTKRN